MNRKSPPAVWSDVLELSERYQRSVHLERDALARSTLQGYVLTPLVRTLIARIGAGLANQQAGRAWSITGPYGTGKSAFSAYLAGLLGTDTETAAEAKKALKRTDSEQHAELYGRGGSLKNTALLPVLITGERRSFEELLLRGLQKAAESFWTRRKPSVVKSIQDALGRLSRGAPLATTEVVALFEETAQKVASSGTSGTGLLVVLDEAGKALEHAAQQPSGDIHLLQELAEAASRSGDAPIVFIVTLHQGFEHYAGRLSVSRQNEWAKVQGRFEDLPFQEASEQVLHLIGAALGAPQFPPDVEKMVRTTAQEVASLVSTSEFQDTRRLTQLLGDVAPLHPATALCLGPLFRSRLAQNERSLFAFLGASEPKGFRPFIQGTQMAAQPGALFTVDQLYDYIVASLGERLYAQRGRQWALIDHALRRLPSDAEELEVSLVKTIGTLGALGEGSGLSANAKTLGVLAAEKNAKKLEAALQRLRKSSLIVFRKYRDSYQLWEGSDLDVDELVRQAMSHVDSQASLVRRLERVAPPRPLVAKRHLFQTGTMRFFDVRYAGEDLLQQNLSESTSGADGVLWLVVPSDDGKATNLREKLQKGHGLLGSSGSERPFIVGVPKHSATLRELASELSALEWTQANVPELHADAVARRELTGRIADTELVLREELSSLMTSDRCAWYFGQEQRSIATSRELSAMLSDVCDAAYDKAPHLFNELLNRRSVSSSSASARRTLMTAMLQSRSKKNLGIVGTPPEMSMYRSLLEAHGMHREENGEWGFFPPRSQRGGGSLLPAWKKIRSILDDAGGGRVQVEEIYEVLRRPPFGIKDGVLPVLIVATLLQRQTEVAVYEDNWFVPHVDAPVVERLLRAPKKFELQQFVLGETGTELYKNLALMLFQSDGTDKSALVPIVKGLVRFMKGQPEYSKFTKTLSGDAVAVREVLERGKEPGTLVFKQLPEALGLKAFSPSQRAPKTEIEEFVTKLKVTLSEIDQSYERLLAQVQEALFQAFDLPHDAEKARAELVARGAPLLELAVDTKLKGFLIRATDDTLALQDWLVSVGTLLGGKPPAAWRDADVEHMYVNLGLVRKKFAVHESLLLADRGPGAGVETRLIRLAVAQQGSPERERIVAVREEDQEKIEFLKEEVASLLRQAQGDYGKEKVLAALALAAEEVMATPEGKSSASSVRKKDLH